MFRLLPLAPLLVFVTCGHLGTAAPAYATLQEEAAIVELMLRSTETVNLNVDVPAGGWPSSSHHCTWAGMQCNRAGHVIAIKLYHATCSVVAPNATAAQPSADSGRDNASVSTGERASSDSALQTCLLPQLARFEWLAELQTSSVNNDLAGSLPDEWWQPGAFPRLRTLAVRIPALEGWRFPVLAPGVLPSLEHLDLELPSLSSTLPASWGRRDTLMSLTELIVEMGVEGPLPPEWALGFRRLEKLAIRDVAKAKSCVAKTSCGAAGHATHPLPAEWGAPNAFPSLVHLQLVGCSVSGPLPVDTWRNLLPRLAHLDLSSNHLKGGLSTFGLERLPALDALALYCNCLTGTLPPEWHSSQAVLLNLEQNMLHGPAFPAEWLLPGALHRLKSLKLASNKGLTGTLPPDLPWPYLMELDVAGTRVSGSIPEQWCRAPFAAQLSSLSIVNTSVARDAVPDCIAHDMSSLIILPHLASTPPDRSLNPHGPSSQAAARLLLACALAAGAGLLVVAVAGRWAWRRRHRQQREHVRARDLQPLLPQPAGVGGVAPDANEGSVASTQQALRRRRLAGLLQQEHLAGSNSCTVVVVAMQQLLHELATSPNGAGSQGSRPPGGSGAVSLARAPSLTPSSHARPASGALAELELGTWQHVSAGTQDDSLPPSRQWGLPTASLQLESTQVQLATGDDGELVQLGEGAQAVVYLGWLAGSMQVAVKVFEIDPGIDSGRIWREAAMLRDCVHERIVPLYGIALRGQVLLLVLRLMVGGTLRQALSSAGMRQQLAWHTRGRQLATDVACALEFLHDRGVLHGDLSSSNVLLDESLSGFIGDLGVARPVRGSAGASVAAFSVTHAAPELLLGQRCTLAADVYSLGILLIELTTGQPVMRRGGWRLPRAPDECSAAVVALIEECTATDAAQRPSAAQVLQRLQADPG